MKDGAVMARFSAKNLLGGRIQQKWMPVLRDIAP
jgi:hypothetical protein